MASTYCKPGDERFTAVWVPYKNEVTLLRDVYAGICGPAGSREANSREEAAQILFELGFLTGDDWKIRLGAHWVSLTRAS